MLADREGCSPSPHAPRTGHGLTARRSLLPCDGRLESQMAFGAVRDQCAVLGEADGIRSGEPDADVLGIGTGRHDEVMLERSRALVVHDVDAGPRAPHAKLSEVMPIRSACR